MKFILNESFTSIEAIEEALKEALSHIDVGRVSGVNPNWSIKLEATDTGIHTFSFGAYVGILAKSEMEAREELNRLFYIIQNDYNSFYKTNIQGTYNMRYIMFQCCEHPDSDCRFGIEYLYYNYDFVCELNIKTESRDVAFDAVYKLIDFERWITIESLVYEETGEVLKVEC